MNFNSLFFPAPSVHYSVNTHFGEMIYIPKDYQMIPDLLTGELKPKLNSHNFVEKSKKHDNDEDHCNNSQPHVKELRKALNRRQDGMGYTSPVFLKENNSCGTFA